MKALLIFAAAIPAAILVGKGVGRGIVWWADAFDVDAADWGDDERDWPEVRG